MRDQQHCRSRPLSAGFEPGSLIRDHLSLDPRKVIAQLTVINRGGSELANMLHRNEIRRLNAGHPT